jgi:hypothetical protein
MEYHIENIKNKVFIADGATWIWNWIEDTYQIVQIVDFFMLKSTCVNLQTIILKTKP